MVLAKDTEIDLVNKVFRLEYCGIDDKKFWDWCKKPNYEPITTKCKKMQGASSHEDCSTIVHFPNNSTLNVVEACSFGPNKNVSERFTQEITKADFNEITSYCINRSQWFWWIILLVVVGSLLVLGISFWCFWKYYLRRKFQPTARERKEQSMLESRFTSAPLSSMVSTTGSSALPSLLTVNTKSVEPYSNSSRSRARRHSRPSSLRGSSSASSLKATSTKKASSSGAFS